MIIGTLIKTFLLDYCMERFFDQVTRNFHIYRRYKVGDRINIAIPGIDRILDGCLVIKSNGTFMTVECVMPSGVILELDIIETNLAAIRVQKNI